MTSMILALDQSAHTGFAVGRAGALPRWGVQHFSGCTGEVISNFRRWVAELCRAEKPTVVAFESPFVPHPGRPSRGNSIPQNAATIRRLMTFAGTIEAVCWDFGVDVREARPDEIAKFFLGSSRPLKRRDKKLATVARCREYGFPVENDNEADALALWLMAEAIVDPAAAARRGFGPLSLAKNARGSDQPPGALSTLPSDRGGSTWPAVQVQIGK